MDAVFRQWAGNGLYRAIMSMKQVETSELYSLRMVIQCSSVHRIVP